MEGAGLPTLIFAEVRHTRSNSAFFQKSAPPSFLRRKGEGKKRKGEGRKRKGEGGGRVKNGREGRVCYRVWKWAIMGVQLKF